MFKKLKQRVEATDSPEKDDTPSARSHTRDDRARVARDLQRGSNEIPRACSTSALSVQARTSSTESLTETSSKKDLVALLGTRTAQMKKLEAKITEYESMLKRSTKDKDKLMLNLESHQDAAIRKIAEMEKEYSDEKSKLNAKISNYEKQKTDFEESMQAIIAENDRLQSALSEWQKREEDFQRRREFENDAEFENDEDLRDFQTQETAKIKHMLMICEKRCDEKEHELQKKEEELKRCKDGKCELEASLRSATDSLKNTSKELASQVQLNEELRKINDTHLKSVGDLKSENARLEHEVDSLTSEVEELKTTLENCSNDKTQSSDEPNLQSQPSDEAGDEVDHPSGQEVRSSTVSAAEGIVENGLDAEDCLHAEDSVAVNNDNANSELLEKYEHAHKTLQMRELELMRCKEEIAYLKNDNTEENEEITKLKSENASLEQRVTDRERSLKLQQQKLNDLKKALNKELAKQASNAASDGVNISTKGRTSKDANYSNDTITGMNGTDDPVHDVAIGSTSVDDPTLSLEQREITVKYLKHVVLKFLSCGQSEGQQLIRALAMLLSLTREEEKYVKETLEYRASWFGVKPSTKKVVKSSVKSSRR